MTTIQLATLIAFLCVYGVYFLYVADVQLGRAGEGSIRIWRGTTGWVILALMLLTALGGAAVKVSGVGEGNALPGTTDTMADIWIITLFLLSALYVIRALYATYGQKRREEDRDLNRIFLLAILLVMGKDLLAAAYVLL